MHSALCAVLGCGVVSPRDGLSHVINNKTFVPNIKTVWTNIANEINHSIVSHIKYKVVE